MKPNTFYHIYNHANGSENLFRTEDNYHYFLKQWVKYIHPVAQSLVYCLMPNHFHFLILTKSEDDVFEYKLKNLQERKQTLGGFKTLGEFKALGGFEYDKIVIQCFSNLFNSYSQAYNKSYNRRGSLFVQNFKRKVIDTNEYLNSVTSYIHRNPVHHGFAESIEDWDFTSDHSYTTGEDSVVDVDVILYSLNGLSSFVQFHKNHFRKSTDASIYFDL